MINTAAKLRPAGSYAVFSLENDGPNSDSHA